MVGLYCWASYVKLVKMGIREKIVKVGCLLADIDGRQQAPIEQALSVIMRGAMVWLAARVMSDPSCRRPN
jgi:hypothetical protein